MTLTQLRRRLIVVGGAALLTITGCLGLAVRANAAASPPSPRAEVMAKVTPPPIAPEPPTQVSAIVVDLSEDPCSPQGLTVLSSESCD